MTYSKSFNKLIKETNRYQNIYSTIGPHDGLVPLNQFNITKKETLEIIQDAINYDGGINKGKDSVDSYTLILYFQELIMDNLNQIVSHKRFKAEKIEGLLKSENQAISITKSPDNNLLCFIVNEKTGGSYRSKLSLIYYVPTKLAVSLAQESESKHADVFNHDGYWNIDTINTNSGTKYLMQGGVQTCGTCYTNYISLFDFANNSVNLDFDYSLEIRGWPETHILKYDKTTRTIKVQYETSDLMEYCYCSEEESNENSEEFDSDNIKECKCQFQFDGNTFKLISHSAE